METVERGVKKFIRLCRERDLNNVQQANARMESLKLERNQTLFDLDLHRETCETCKKKSPEEIIAFHRCDKGADLALAYHHASRVLRNGGL